MPGKEGFISQIRTGYQGAAQALTLGSAIPEIDRESTYEILSKKLGDAAGAEQEEEKTPRRKRGGGERSLLVMAGGSMARQVGRTVAQELTRGLLGVLGIGRRRRSRNSWF